MFRIYCPTHLTKVKINFNDQEISIRFCKIISFLTKGRFLATITQPFCDPRRKLSTL